VAANAVASSTLLFQYELTIRVIYAFIECYYEELCMCDIA